MMILTKDPRTVYSLAMILILYEAYQSEYLISERLPVRVIKFTLLGLIATQLIFLYLCGLSHANLKSKFNGKLSEVANYFYVVGFQSSTAVLLLDFSFDVVYTLFKDTGIFLPIWGKILLMAINFFMVAVTIHIRKKVFEPKLNWNDDPWFCILIGFWVFGTTAFIVSKILQTPKI